MRITRRSGADERRILIGMITDRTVIARIASLWPTEGEGLFRSDWSNLIARWCVGYFQKYDSPPKGAIESQFEVWADRHPDDAAVETIDRFLRGLSGEYERLEPINSDYLINLAGTHFDLVRLDRLSRKLEVALDSGDVQRAREDAIQATRRLDFGPGAYVNILSDTQSWYEALSNGEGSSPDLIQYHGALGHFLRGHLERDALVAFLASQKRGKSFWLMDLAFRGAMGRLKTAYIIVGDMSMKQILRRLASRIAQHPYRAKEWPATIKIPTQIKRNQDEQFAEVVTREETFAGPVEFDQAIQGCDFLRRRRLRSDRPWLQIAVYPSMSVNVLNIRAEMAGWEQRDWNPDLVVLDYADNLAPTPGEERHAINRDWAQLRAISQEFSCLVVTATQADAGSYGRRVLSRRNFSWDNRKANHVTLMVGINQTPLEKDIGICRLNILHQREGNFSEGRVVHVAGCLDIGEPALVSCY